MILIKDKESYDRNHELINQFSVIYNQAFPDENEREVSGERNLLKCLVVAQSAQANLIKAHEGSLKPNL